MNNKLNMIPLAIGLFTSELIADALAKILVTGLAMVFGTIVSFWVRKYLVKYDKKYRDQPNILTRAKAWYKKYSDEWIRDDEKNNTDGV